MPNLSEKHNILHCRNNAKIYQENKIYYTVGIMPKSNRKTKYTTLSEQCQNLTEKQNIDNQGLWDGGSAGTSVWGKESQEGASEPLKGP